MIKKQVEQINRTHGFDSGTHKTSVLNKTFL